MSRIIRNFPLHIFILPLFFIVKTINQYSGLISVKDSVLPFVKVLSCCFIIFLLLYFIFKDIIKAGILVTVLGIFILFFDNIKETFRSLPFLKIFGHYRFYLPLVIGLSVFICYKIVKAKRLTRLNFFLNILLLVYFLIEIWNLSVVANMTSAKKNVLGSKSTAVLKTGEYALPNIYYILLDCYPSSSYQKEILGVNNNLFDSSLRAKGFYIANNSTSNYNRTAFSMAATLNMEYLKWLDSETTVTDYAKALSILKYPSSYALLKKTGYQFRNLSIFDIGDQLSTNRESFFTASVEQVIFYNTFWDFLRRQWYWRFDVQKLKTQSTDEMKKIYEPKREYNQKVLDSLTRIAQIKANETPFLLYAHLYLPHFPYFYDAGGKPYDDTSLYNDSLITDRRKFIGYVTYTNKKILSVLDSLFLNGGRDIIVLQSDHGIEDIPPSTHADAFRNYFAIYFPDHDYRLLYDSVSNVNTFRIILNKYLGYNFPLLKDRSLYLKN